MRLDRKRIDLTLKRPWTIARESSATRGNVLVRLSHAGIDAFGEAAPSARYGEDSATVLAALGLLEGCLGEEPGQHEKILDRLDAAVPGNRAAKAAIDIALHDWIGRKKGVALHEMLGLDPEKAPPTCMSIGIDVIPVMQEKAREASEFTILKIKVEPRNAREILQGIRQVADQPFYVDANEGWRDPEQVVELIRWMEGIGVVLVEQPLPAADLDGAKAIRDRVEMPIFADEGCLTPADLPRLAGAFDGVNVKLQKAGGLLPARRTIEAARSLGMKVLLGCMVETSIGITAAAHLSPLADHVDLDGHLLITNDPFRGVVVREGRLVLPRGPGLGVEGTW
jgi:L-Ala-D/L-Glu epimerase / N-acetyl-D-glutamate racemase